MTIILFILILGIIVFIHELGHFIFAKKAGVYVYEFSLGFGPKLFSFKKKNEQWLKAYLFLLSCEGVLLFPVVMLLSYFDLSLQVAVIYTIIVLVLVKILSFYKSYLIFFKRNGLFLQIILYFLPLYSPVFNLFNKC